MVVVVVVVVVLGSGGGDGGGALTSFAAICVELTVLQKKLINGGIVE